MDEEADVEKTDKSKSRNEDNLLFFFKCMPLHCDKQKFDSAFSHFTVKILSELKHYDFCQFFLTDFSYFPMERIQISKNKQMQILEQLPFCLLQGK